MNDVAVTALLNGGGVLVFAFLIWKGQEAIKAALEKKADETKAAIEKLEETTVEESRAIQDIVTRMVERLARIDERTFRAETIEGIPPRGEPLRRPRVKTPAPIPPRPRNQTPFTGGDKDR